MRNVTILKCILTLNKVKNKSINMILLVYHDPVIQATYQGGLGRI